MGVGTDYFHNLSIIMDLQGLSKKTLFFEVKGSLIQVQTCEQKKF